MSKCMHLVDGRRCKRWAQWAFSVTYQWDPIKGTGIEGPDVRMCRQHGNSTLDCKDHARRWPVVDGWFGRVWNAQAQVWTINYCVFSAADGHTGSKEWAKYKRPCASGDMRKRVDYDEVRAT